MQEFTDSMSNIIKYNSSVDRGTGSRYARKPQSIAVAVSGGTDSLALACLAHQWSQNSSHNVSALIIDHGIRPESLLEARFAAETLFQNGFAQVAVCSVRWDSCDTQQGRPRKHLPFRIHTLVITSPRDSADAFNQLAGQTSTGSGKVSISHDMARQARLAAFREGLDRLQADAVMLGHHAGDQAETVLLRMGRRSRLRGLGGMEASTSLPAPRAGAGAGTGSGAAAGAGTEGVK